MGTEVFRFVTIRPPQDPVDGATSGAFIDLEIPNNAFLGSLRQVRLTGTRAGMQRVVTDFQTTPQFVGSTNKLDQKILDFTTAVRRFSAEEFWSAAGQAFATVFGTTAAKFVNTPAFATPFADVASSIVAAAIDASIHPDVRGLLIKTLRALWLIQRLADSAEITRSAFVNAPIVLPDGIFPLPQAEDSVKNQQAAAEKAYQAAAADRRSQIAQLNTELTSRRNAATELLNAFERTGPKPAQSTPQNTRGTPPTAQPSIGFLLTDATVVGLSDSTKSALQKVGVSLQQVDVAKTVTLLERQATAIGKQLNAATGSNGTMVQLGNTILPQNALITGWPIVPLPPSGTGAQTPGPCPPAPAVTQSNGVASVPTGHGDARVLGIADLLVVEQELLRYELGEIAHIENVLRTEVRSREFKTVDTLQQIVTTTTETTQEKEQDLSSTQRFELKTESQTVINDTASHDAGLTIHASYGPSVDATANYNVSGSNSTQQSNSASTSYATEVTSKAVDRVQTRTLTTRTVTATHEADEINRHSFDNTSGTDNIVGIYRFVDKIYSAQIVNYGKRLMLEFIVPEPAAFLRYALTNKPVTNVMQPKPDPPGYCLGDGTTFVPLQASDITRDNYLFWTSKYGAHDVAPPPASIMIAEGSLKSPDQMQTVGDRLLCSDMFDVTIPDGYLTQSAYVNIYGASQSGDPDPFQQIVVQVEDQQSSYSGPSDDNFTWTLHLEATPKLTVTVNSLGFHNYEILATVFCTLSDEAFQDWQLKTFNSIMNAYNDLKTNYDTAVAEARLQASDTTVMGTNPETNRVVEQTELKKGCISLLTGQRFELFDAMQRNVAPYGYPEIDFNEAKAEGLYISMFEQSFEWNNMVYLFYPYFWGKKDDWVTLVQLTDNDPLFAQFLHSGSARVQVPVRLGFEQNILTYLSTGEIWAGEGTIVNSQGGNPDPWALSIIDELKSQTNDNNVDGVGTLTVTHGSDAITGSGTEFTLDDENRRIIIGGVTYVIKSVHNPLTITLVTPYAGAAAQGLRYATGGKLVGQPWEVKLPTDLVKLDGSMVIN